MGKVLCTRCIFWVECKKENGKDKGYCVLEPLYTYTSREKCEDFNEGTPINEQQYEDFNASIY